MKWPTSSRRIWGADGENHSIVWGTLAAAGPRWTRSRQNGRDSISASTPANHDGYQQTVLSYTADIPPSLLTELILSGTPDEILDQAAEWRDHGMRYAVMNNLSSLQPSLRRGLAATIPFTKILGGLRRL
jgi:alkanesulfonate monooxygenase SsuD/methylene tetrahydromethanopterin reductase-like flavin-dependent oxidoreductase (luciferase family)